MENNISEQLLEWNRNRFFGKYRGLVTDNNDPTNRGRVKVHVPAVLGDLESWAMPCIPYAGENIGIFMMPKLKAGVWVEFEGGDPSFPIWTGGFWADNELPKNEKGDTVTPSLKAIRSETGLMVTMNDTEQVITLSDEDGSNIMTIEVEKGKIRIEGNLKVVVEAPQIELVENATHPVVFGDELMTYLNTLVQLFNTHTHMSPFPPVPQFPPPVRPVLLSNIVKSG